MCHRLQFLWIASRSLRAALLLGTCSEGFEFALRPLHRLWLDLMIRPLPAIASATEDRWAGRVRVLAPPSSPPPLLFRPLRLPPVATLPGL
eukprot:gene11766-biopygen13955